MDREEGGMFSLPFDLDEVALGEFFEDAFG